VSRRYDHVSNEKDGGARRGHARKKKNAATGGKKKFLDSASTRAVRTGKVPEERFYVRKKGGSGDRWTRSLTTRRASSVFSPKAGLRREERGVLSRKTAEIGKPELQQPQCPPHVAAGGKWGKIGAEGKHQK